MSEHKELPRGEYEKLRAQVFDQIVGGLKGAGIKVKVGKSDKYLERIGNRPGHLVFTCIKERKRGSIFNPLVPTVCVMPTGPGNKVHEFQMRQDGTYNIPVILDRIQARLDYMSEKEVKQADKARERARQTECEEASQVIVDRLEAAYPLNFLGVKLEPSRSSKTTVTLTYCDILNEEQATKIIEALTNASCDEFD